MLRKEDFLMIQALARRSVYQCDIAAELGVHPKTVSRALCRGAAPEGRRRPEYTRPLAIGIAGGFGAAVAMLAAGRPRRTPGLHPRSAPGMAPALRRCTHAP